jgi:flavin-dependent dehydrogenase
MVLMRHDSMTRLKPITIIGGGLAGLTLGIALRQHSVPVVVLEAGHYPRHRVCGEFIHGRGQETLRRLGLFESIRKAGGLPARTVGFFSADTSFPIRALPQPALCLSRFLLDALLAERFCELGGTLHCDSPLRPDQFDEATVRTTGRRPRPMASDWHWFGLKAHAKNVVLHADLEMHLGKNSYIGLCQLPGGQINVCGLFRRRKNDPIAQHGRVDCLRGEPGSLLYKRLRPAIWHIESICAVAGLSFAPQRAADSVECRLGDTLTMTPPITGNGMSMAFEAADLALNPLLSYASGETCWPATQRRIREQCDVAFASRLRWANLLQNALLRYPHRFLLRIFLGSNILWRLAYSLTR